MTWTGFTRGRIVALLLIAVVVAGLGYLRATRDPDTVSVPAGAHAGQLTLERCSYPTEHGDYRADCGTLVVPENRRAPRSRLIALPVTRIRAKSSRPGEPIFRLEGGPGRSNMKFADASRFAAHHDVVLVGYRGVDGSSVLECPEVASAMKHSRDLLGEKSHRAVAAGYRSCAVRLRGDGVDLAGYTLPQRVDDLEAARRALGYRQVDLLSESAGTRTAMVYSWRYPRTVHRSVMIGVNPPGHFLWTPATTDAQIRHYAELCARATACRDRTDDLAGTMRHVAADLPDRWLFLPIRRGNVRLGSFFGLMESTAEAGPLAAPSTIDSWLSADDGDASGFWLLSLMGALALPDLQVWGDVAAIGRADAGAARRYFSAGGDHGSILGNPGTEFLWRGGRLLDAWPGNADDDAYSRVRTSKTETLLIGGSVDFSTPAQNATRELLPHLPNGRQVVLAELGHTTDFWGYEPAASSRLINTFLDTGRVDDSLYRARTMDFEAGVKQTALAKWVAGALVGLPLLALLTLASMWRRVRRRGRAGRKTSVLARSLLPVPLGLGGWVLAVLVILTTSAAVPLDDQSLVAGSVGAPIAIGIYLAWVDQGWSARTRATGLLAAIAGALIGAVLGFEAGADMLALITSIVGAAAGANLAVLTATSGSPNARLTAPSSRRRRWRHERCAVRLSRGSGRGVDGVGRHPQSVPGAHCARTRHEGTNREARRTLARDRAQDVEVAFDAPWLRPRRHHAPFDPHADVEHRVAECDRGSDQRVLVLAVEQHVGPEPAAIP